MSKRTMDVLMYYSNRDVRVEEMSVPEIGPGEMLMKVLASGICGSDVMEWYRRDKVPLVLGHEVAGEVIDVGGGVRKFRPGDRVAATHHVPCNTCHYCLNGHHTVCETLLAGTHFHPGGFAEYIRIPAINVDRGVFSHPPGCLLRKSIFYGTSCLCLERSEKRKVKTWTVRVDPGKRNIRIAPYQFGSSPRGGFGGSSRLYSVSPEKG